MHDYNKIVANPLRLVVVGNSGSGKSTIAKRIGSARNLRPLDLDEAYWLADGQKRERSEAVSILKELANTPDWIVEGVYEFLLEIALSRATELMWLKLPWEECRDGLLQRGLHYGMDPRDPDALQEWADAHQERLENQSQIYDKFEGRKMCFRSRREIADFADNYLSQESQGESR